ncbi:MAG: hypothetical protein H7249_12500 [Chitinophagaceae bacterium]|nr:hypothetical protein [Oligoflexus sp.]
MKTLAIMRTALSTSCLFSLIALVLSVATACSVQPEAAGQCKLICGGSIVGSNDTVMSISVKSQPVDTECAPSQATKTVGPYTAMFLVGEQISDEKGNKIGVRPVPNISIDPRLIGNRPALMNENDSPGTYRGLATLKNNWCSDACGVVTLEAYATCPEVGSSDSLSIQVHSGALFSESAIFPITTKTPVAN